jgi:hypothetical protein
MITITKDICVYCLNKATYIKKTSKYIVGLCEKHKYLSKKEIDDIIGETKIKKNG